jgi:ABC-2 type transport system permease protein
MTGVIFTHTLRKNWRQILYWGVGMALLGVYILALLPNVDMIEQYRRLFETLPPTLLAAFGMSDLDQLATPEGFISFAYFSYMMMIMSAYGVIAGMNVTAVEEDRGILDMLLSAPISRTQLVIEKCAAYIVIMLLIVLVSFSGFVIGSLFSVPIDLGMMFAGSVNMFPGTLTVFGFTVFAGALFRRRGTALAVASGFVVVSYFIDFIGEAASDTVAAALRVISYYSYYGGGSFASTGFQWGNVALLTAAGVVLFFVGMLLFRRRDIGL